MTDFLDLGTPVAAPPATIQRLMTLFDAMTDTAKLAAAAVGDGIRPPDDRDGWTIVGAYLPGKDAPGLYWLHPDDEPDTQVD